jgi:hypothetical protein
MQGILFGGDRIFENNTSLTKCKVISMPAMNLYTGLFVKFRAFFTLVPHRNEYPASHFDPINPRRYSGMYRTGNWVSQVYILNVTRFGSCNKSVP